MRGYTLALCVITFLLAYISPGTYAYGQEDNDIRSNNQTVRVTSILMEPFLSLKKNYESITEGNDRFEGFVADLLTMLSQKVPFKYEIHLVSDGTYGRQDPLTGRWTGMVGELLNNYADVAAAPLTITPMRRTVVDFTVKWMDVSLSVLVHKDSGINTLDDLVNQSKISYGIIESGSTMSVFQSSRKQPYAKMWSTMSAAQPSVFVRSIDTGLSRVKRGDFAFIMENNSAHYYVNSEKYCDLKVIGDFLPREGYGFAVQKNSELKGKLNRALNKMKQNGEIEKLYAKWWKVGTCGSSCMGPSLVVLAIACVSHLLHRPS